MIHANYGRYDITKKIVPRLPTSGSPRSVESLCIAWCHPWVLSSHCPQEQLPQPLHGHQDPCACATYGVNVWFLAARFKLVECCFFSETFVPDLRWHELLHVLYSSKDSEPKRRIVAVELAVRPNRFDVWVRGVSVCRSWYTVLCSDAPRVYKHVGVDLRDGRYRCWG